MASGYDIYWDSGAGRAGAIDWDTSIGHVGPGAATADLVGLGLAQGVYWFGARATTEAGVQEAGTAAVVRVEIDGDAALVGARPNALLAARAVPAAGGDLTVRVSYTARDQAGAATGVEIAERQADGTWGFGSPLATIAVGATGISRRSATIDGSWQDGQTVRLAARAVTAAGVAGPVFVLDPVRAAASAPAAISYLEATAL